MTIGEVAVLLAAVSLAAAGQLMLKHGMNEAKAASKQPGGSLLAAAGSSPWVIAGLVVFAGSAVAWLLTLSRVPLSTAYPFNALGFLAILAASVVVLHERVNAWTWVGTAMVVSGLVIVVVTAAGQGS